jgi:GTP-binding protein
MKMRKQIVAIVGRPNVGKSTLFNRVLGKKVAVVEDFPGLTRDRLYGEARWGESSFLVVDTGGFQPAPEEDIIEEVKKQAIAAIEESDVVVMLLDAESGLLPSDEALVKTIREYGKKVFFAVNKIDSSKKEKAMYEFYSLGADVLPVSAKTGYGFDELMDSIAGEIPRTAEAVESSYPRIAVVGRPNVGKSTLVNSLLGRNRVIVSPIPGTTRDSIDSICGYYRKKYLIIDTAGIRKKGKMARSYERYSFIRTLKNIESCDIALVLLDAEDGVVELDQRIAGLAYEAGKGCIILVNKWDLVEKDSMTAKRVEEQIYQKLWFMNYAPVLTISALNRKRTTKIFPIIDEVVAEASRKISTRRLNTFLRNVLSVRHPPLFRGKRIRLSYITQTGIRPPSFTLFVNRVEGIRPGYIRFVEKKLRETFSFKGVPVRIHVRQKS